jgi:uncharacterized membrane protein
MARQKVAVGVHKLLAEAVGLQTEQEPQVQLVHYLAVEPVVLAIFMEAVAVAVATTEEAVAVLIPTAPATTQEPEVADLLSLIRSTHQTSPTSPE